ncbi:hypothetical protein [Caballeronia sp. GAFFF1]|uniref:hypothetical protein n=1 Tax=Caballeronia sp. GAFFF1 TaxID=2921779 RepID=UPI002029284B|nr:hypothetical protein [Caballeronia sp. GAFFF1]
MEDIDVNAIAVKLSEALLGATDIPGLSAVGTAIIGHLFPSQEKPPSYFTEVYQQIRNIVHEELVANDISNVNNFINGVVSWVRADYSVLKDEPDHKAEAAKNLDNYNNDFFTKVLSVLYAYPEASFSVFLVGAGVHMALLQELALTDAQPASPLESAYVRILRGRADEYVRHVREVWPRIVQKRRDAFSFNVERTLVTVGWNPDGPLPPDTYYYVSWADATTGQSNRRGASESERGRVCDEMHAEMAARQQAAVEKLANDLGAPETIATNWERLRQNPLPTVELPGNTVTVRIGTSAKGFDVEHMYALFRKTPSHGNWPGGFDVKAGSPVQSLRVYCDGDKMVGLKWTFFDGTEHGVADTADHHASTTVHFQRGETLQTFTLWMTGYSGGAGCPFGLELTTSTGQHFSANARDWPVQLDDVKGRCLMGFHGGTHGPQNPFVSALGLWLSPTFDEFLAMPRYPAPLPSVHLEGVEPTYATVEPAQPAGNCGFRVIVIDGANPSNSNAIRLNRYFSTPNVPYWLYANSMAEVYKDIHSAIKGKLDQSANLLIVASFGMDLHLVPTDEMVRLLQSAGAGEHLQTWRKLAKIPTDWSGDSLCNYVLAGYFGGNEGVGVDQFEVGLSLKLEAVMVPPLKRASPKQVGSGGSNGSH